jgi:hypothetical protein
MFCNISPSILHAQLSCITDTPPKLPERKLAISPPQPETWEHLQTADTKQAVTVNPKPPLKSTSLNWDMPSPGSGPTNAPILTPRDVIQVAFMLDQESNAEESHDETSTAAGDSRKVLGQLAIQWRSALGDRGSLSTGWLTSRR